MIIDLASLGNDSKRITVAFDPADIDLDGESLQLRGKTSFDGEIELADEKARLRGHLTATVLVDCTRCLEAIEKELDFSFRAIFVGSDQVDARPEAEIGDEALDESLIPDGLIDMAEVVREQILLAVPVQVFCTDDCRGLCSKCGSNLNLIDCKCADDEMDPRWAALKNLK